MVLFCNVLFAVLKIIGHPGDFTKLSQTLSPMKSLMDCVILYLIACPGTFFKRSLQQSNHLNSISIMLYIYFSK